MAGMPHRHVAGGIEHPLIGEDAAGRREVLEHRAFDRAARTRRYFHGITETWMAPGAPCPPTDLIA